MDCTICLGEIDVAVEEPKKLDCKHEFHKECIEEWLLKGKKTCPCCRALVMEEAKRLIMSRLEITNYTNCPITPEKYIEKVCIENDHHVYIDKPYGVVTRCYTCGVTKCYNYLG